MDFNFDNLKLWAIDYRKGGKVLYDQELTDPIKRITNTREELNAVVKAEIQVGDMVLLTTSDETFAKVKFDKITATKIHFSYVLEASEPVEKQPVTKPKEPQSSSVTPNDQLDLIYWGEVRTGIYDLEFPILNEQGQLTGYDLHTQKMTKNASAVDFKFDNLKLWAIDYRKGGKVLYDQELTDPIKRITNTREELSTVVKAEIQVGDLVLLTTSDETFAKVQFDKITATKVHFSYVLEAAEPEEKSEGSASQEQKDIDSEPKDSEIILQLGSTKATVNGRQVLLDVSPEIISGSSMVPLRFIAEALGAKVAWDGNEYKITLTLNGDIVELWIGHTDAIVNGAKASLNAPAQIIDDTTMVPVRFVSENLKQHVQYEVSAKRITITPKK
ncbi:MAG: copper amine oxidase domain protein [Paenibacillus sp.]|nr:copper amine oxidase domain protein [Paenibacillus sp.]